MLTPSTSEKSFEIVDGRTFKIVDGQISSKSEIPAEQQTPQGFFVCDHAGFEINDLSKSLMLTPRRVRAGDWKVGFPDGKGLLVECEGLAKPSKSILPWVDHTFKIADSNFEGLVTC